jgi:hypothetical protein
MLLVSGLLIIEGTMETLAIPIEETLTRFDGKPVIDGSLTLTLKNPVSGLSRRAFILGTRTSVYKAILSFAREQWIPPRLVEYSLIHTQGPAIPVEMSDCTERRY